MILDDDDYKFLSDWICHENWCIGQCIHAYDDLGSLKHKRRLKLLEQLRDYRLKERQDEV